MAESNTAPSSKRQELAVTPEESGMKLLRFLERRLGGAVPKSMLYKWIRTGQVRVNKGRSDPHRPLQTGDAIRVPPFADPKQFAPGTASGTASGASSSSAPCSTPATTPATTPETPPAPAFRRQPALDALGPDLPVIAHTQDVLVLAKPQGLAVHPGTAIADSLTKRLAAAFADQPFIPAPAHRLDRQTSGLILVGTTHKGQAALHEYFATGAMQKQYLAWVLGRWPHTGPTFLVDEAACFQSAGGRQSLQHMPAGRQIPLGATDETAPANAQALAEIWEAAQQGNSPGLALVMPVRALQAQEMPKMPGASKGATLLLIQLITGKKHQIRIQTASRKHPVIGDNRYGGPRFPQMLLHAFFVRLPAAMANAAFSVPPAWPSPFQPRAAELASASAALEAAYPQQV